MNDILLIALFLQIVMLCGGIVFLWRTRSTIIPASVWWAFLLNDLLWIALICDQIARLSNYSLMPIEATIVVSFAITSLFLFRLWMRYQAHRKRQLLNVLLLEIEQKLERERKADEERHGHNWDNLRPLSIRPHVYRIEAHR